MYGVLHVDSEAHTVNLAHLKDIVNVPVFVEPLDPYKLHGVRVFDSSSFRMVLCFFDRFYVTVGDRRVLEFDSPPAYMEHMHVSLYDVVYAIPGSTLTRTLCRLWREVDGSLTLKPARSFAICEA